MNTTPAAPRACQSCRFSEMKQAPPPQIMKARYCMLLPPQLFAIMQPGGMAVVAGHPQVNDAEWCHQYAAGDPVTATAAPAAGRPGLSSIK